MDIVTYNGSTDQANSLDLVEGITPAINDSWLAIGYMEESIKTDRVDLIVKALRFLLQAVMKCSLVYCKMNIQREEGKA